MFNGKDFHKKTLNDTQLLNKKSELINACCHQNKLLLTSLQRSNGRCDSMN